MLMTLDSFWTLLSSKSPFLMVSWYCQFLLSGLQSDRTRMRGTVVWGVKLFTEAFVFEELYLLVSTISLTLSILQWRRPAAMNRDSSLRDKGITQLTWCPKQMSIKYYMKEMSKDTQGVSGWNLTTETLQGPTL